MTNINAKIVKNVLQLKHGLHSIKLIAWTTKLIVK